MSDLFPMQFAAGAIAKRPTTNVSPPTAATAMRWKGLPRVKMKKPVLAAVFAFALVCHLPPISLGLRRGRDESPLDDVLSVLSVSEVQKRVFEASSSSAENWLLVFHHGPHHRLVYEAIDIIALAAWIKSRKQLLSFLTCRVQ